jgi:hypothetical protein
MRESRNSRLLEVRVGRLKARAHAKQHWLERLLSSPAEGPRQDLMRKRWIAEALDRIKRTQDTLAYRASLLDAYSEHLHVLEMTLMGAAEEKGTKTESKS